MKKTKNLIILLVVLAVAIVIYIAATIIANREEKNNETPEETKITIIDKTASDVASVSLESSSSNYTIDCRQALITLKTIIPFPLIRQKPKPSLKPFLLSNATVLSRKPEEIQPTTVLTNRFIR